MKTWLKVIKNIPLWIKMFIKGYFFARKQYKWSRYHSFRMTIAMTHFMGLVRWYLTTEQIDEVMLGWKKEREELILKVNNETSKT